MQKAFETVKQLVANFKAQESAYLSPGYQESQIRQDFIDKFFTALGWDVTHNVQMNPYQQEVHIENKVHMAGSQRRADYAFFFSPNFRDPKFFVEAKKPSRNLANPDDYYQTIRYGWNANTPIAILTDFEEFHILDCRYKPSIKEVMNHKIEYFHYSDYANEEKFSRIYWLFSREAVASGSLEKQTAELPKPRGKGVQRGVFKGGYEPVDEAFLVELDKYREVLAKAFKKSNPDLQSEELTEAVQRTIDRLVFIRFLEDKQIEEPEIINLQSKKSAWNGFLALGRQLDPKYNGLVFKPHKVLDGKEFVPPDDEDFGTICRELSDPQSPYNFDQIPISILGSIYERFLGKVVHATDKRVKVEEKPEVRKAGGVYYTPEYIVRYIVSETVGKLIEGKTPNEVAQMAFADIACGSGSFLIEVYNQLLEYHIRYYVAHPEKQKEADIFERDGKLHLTLKKKKEILLNNVYGVDIDFQATEVTQLSLYLKLLEDVTMHDAHQFGMFKETILPDLRKNIVNGNSLIGRDIIEGQLFVDIDENKLKPTNFEDAFPTVMKRSGFDAVVGNPPYGATFSITEKEFLDRNYIVSEGNYESFSFFIEKAVKLLKKKGKLGYIVPDTWFTIKSALKLRRFILDETSICSLQVMNELVFKNVKVDVCTIILDKSKSGIQTIITIYDKDATPQELEIGKYLTKRKIEQDKWRSNNEHAFVLTMDSIITPILDKIEKNANSLDGFFIVGAGCKPYELGKGSPPQTKKTIEGRKYTSTSKLNKTYRRLIRGADIERYGLNKRNNEWLSYGPWLAAQRNPDLFKGERLLFQSIRNPKLERRLIGTLVSDDSINNNSITNIITKNENYSLRFILGLLNSSLFNCYFATKYCIVNIDPRYLKMAPLHKINFDDSQDKSRHDHIVRLVEQMLDAKEKLSNAKTEAETNRLEMQCQTLDRQIDEAVYELYGLTEEEIKIVEGK